MANNKMLIIPMSEVPPKEVFKQVEAQLHRLIKVVKKYPQKDDNIEFLEKGLSFIESLSWRIK
jgi:hypothetical protein